MRYKVREARSSVIGWIKMFGSMSSSFEGRRQTLRHIDINAYKYFSKLSSVFLCSLAIALNLVQSNRPLSGSNTTPNVETTL